MRAPRATLLLGLVVLCATFGSAWSTVVAAPGQPATPVTPSEPMLEHADPVASYTLFAKLDPYAHVLHGMGTITWRNASKHPVSEVWLHLYLTAFKNQSWGGPPTGSVR